MALERLWTKERLTQMKDEFLPQCTALGQALDLAKRAYKRSVRPDVKTFRHNFASLFKKSPAAFLRADVTDKSLKWPAARLEWMKNVGLPESRTVVEAVQKAIKKYNQNLDLKFFQYKFTQKYGHAPTSFLKIKVLAEERDVELPPNENPVFLRREIKRLETELKRATEQSHIASLIKNMLRKTQTHQQEELGWLETPVKQELFHGGAQSHVG